jgi:protein arginine N-methyltransferase 1
MRGNPVSFHRMLLNDDVRMRAYRTAILQTVKPGDTVLDVGSGSGILAIFACQAGASRVYAVERGPVITAARALAEANGFADRIVFLNQNIGEVELIEPVDVVVSELIGKAVLGQAMAEITGLCRDRFLKPGGRMIPDRVHLWVAPAETPALYAKSRLPERASWGIDFSGLQRYASNLPISARVPPTALLAAGQTAYSHHALSSPPIDQFDTRLTFTIERSGVLHSLAAWFSSVLADGVELSNYPPGLRCWDNLVFPLPEPLPVTAGTTIQVHLRGRSGARTPTVWVWDTAVLQDGNTAAEYRQSTFFGQLLSPEVMRHKVRS